MLSDIPLGQEMPLSKGFFKPIGLRLGTRLLSLQLPGALKSSFPSFHQPFFIMFFFICFEGFFIVFEMFRVSKLAAEVPEAKILSVFRVENPTLARDPVVTASWGRFPCFSPKFLWIFHGFSMRFHVIFHGFHWFLMGFQARTTLEAGVYAAVRDAMGSDCELDLWHGTSSSCVPNIVLNGFNRAYSGRSHGPPAPKASTFLRHFKACEWRHGQKSPRR